VSLVVWSVLDWSRTLSLAGETKIEEKRMDANAPPTEEAPTPLSNEVDLTKLLNSLAVRPTTTRDFIDFCKEWCNGPVWKESAAVDWTQLEVTCFLVICDHLSPANQVAVSQVCLRWKTQMLKFPRTRLILHFRNLKETRRTKEKEMFKKKSYGSYKILNHVTSDTEGTLLNDFFCFVLKNLF
jgi:hypothetical protein